MLFKSTKKFLKPVLTFGTTTIFICAQLKKQRYENKDDNKTRNDATHSR